MAFHSESTGLTKADVAQRVADGRVNVTPQGTSRSVGQIVFANIFNPVNAIMLALFVLIMIAGFPRDGLFVGVVVGNSVIGIAQELYARRELNKLQLLNAPGAVARRDGTDHEIDIEGIVVDDVLVVTQGDQLVVDGEVIASDGLEADESLLTGESDPIAKAVGDTVLSGSFVSAGNGLFRTTKVGADSYANSLAEEAKQFKLVDSELRRGIDLVLRVLVFLIPPVGALLLFSLLDVEDEWQNALQGTVAAAVAMVPDGLVLLTSLSFVTGVITIARRKALAKELATVELLARVDTLCLDKTGTITTGAISFGSIVPLGEYDDDTAGAALGAVAASDPKPNATMGAVAKCFDPSDSWSVTGTEPFSSARKWSGASFADQGTFFFGAPDILFADDDTKDRELAAHYAQDGMRVLLLTRSDGALSEGPGGVRHPVCLILLEDTVRDDAPEILRFFSEQGVNLKVISGDNVATVAAVAERAGVPNARHAMDARDITDDKQMAEALESTTVFGRVTPHQKRAMVGLLQENGRVVAMTGDGVNDVLALKDSDMGIAMGSGSSASRGVAQLVLMDDRFATLPEVLAQGRKVINNIERVANLFVTKATYAVLLTAIIGFQKVEFPFLPRQLTLIGTFSIGLPGLVLALAPNASLVRTGFLDRVLRFSLPAGFVAGLVTWFVYNFSRGQAASDNLTTVELSDARSAATITLLGLGLVVLVVVSRPLRLWKVGLAAVMATFYAMILAVQSGRDYFQLTIPDAAIWGVSGLSIIVGGLAIVAIPFIVPGIRDAATVDVTTSSG